MNKTKKPSSYLGDLKVKPMKELKMNELQDLADHYSGSSLKFKELAQRQEEKSMALVRELSERKGKLSLLS